jgi:hypothetical protein
MSLGPSPVLDASSSPAALGDAYTIVTKETHLPPTTVLARRVRQSREEAIRPVPPPVPFTSPSS